MKSQTGAVRAEVRPLRTTEMRPSRTTKMQPVKSAKVPVRQANSKIPQPVGVKSGNGKPKARPAPDFGKVHQKWNRQFEVGKVCRKKPQTIAREFDITKPGLSTKMVTRSVSRELFTEADFEADQRALDTILNSKGTVVVSRRATTANDTKRSQSCTNLGRRRVLGELPCDLDLTSDSNRRRSLSAGNPIPLKSLKEEEEEEVFQVDPQSLQNIMNEKMTPSRVAAPKRQTTAGASLRQERPSIYDAMTSSRHMGSAFPSSRMTDFGPSCRVFKQKHGSHNVVSPQMKTEKPIKGNKTHVQCQQELVEEFEADPQSLRNIINSDGLSPVRVVAPLRKTIGGNSLRQERPSIYDAMTSSRNNNSIFKQNRLSEYRTLSAPRQGNGNSMAARLLKQNLQKKEQFSPYGRTPVAQRVQHLTTEEDPKKVLKESQGKPQKHVKWADIFQESSPEYKDKIQKTLFSSSDDFEDDESKENICPVNNQPTPAKKSVTCSDSTVHGNIAEGFKIVQRESKDVKSISKGPCQGRADKANCQDDSPQEVSPISPDPNTVSHPLCPSLARELVQRKGCYQVTADKTSTGTLLQIPGTDDQCKAKEIYAQEKWHHVNGINEVNKQESPYIIKSQDLDLKCNENECDLISFSPQKNDCNNQNAIDIFCNQDLQGGQQNINEIILQNGMKYDSIQNANENNHGSNWLCENAPKLNAQGNFSHELQNSHQFKKPFEKEVKFKTSEVQSQRRTMAMHTEVEEEECENPGNRETIPTAHKTKDSVDKFVGRIRKAKKRQSIAELNESISESNMHMSNLSQQAHKLTNLSRQETNTNIMIQLQMIQKQQEQLLLLQKQLQQQLLKESCDFGDQSSEREKSCDLSNQQDSRDVNMNENASVSVHFDHLHNPCFNENERSKCNSMATMLVPQKLQENVVSELSQMKNIMEDVYSKTEEQSSLLSVSMCSVNSSTNNVFLSPMPKSPHTVIRKSPLQHDPKHSFPLYMQTPPAVSQCLMSFSPCTPQQINNGNQMTSFCDNPSNLPLIKSPRPMRPEPLQPLETVPTQVSPPIWTTFAMKNMAVNHQNTAEKKESNALQRGNNFDFECVQDRNKSVASIINSPNASHQSLRNSYVNDSVLNVYSPRPVINSARHSPFVSIGCLSLHGNVQASPTLIQGTPVSQVLHASNRSQETPLYHEVLSIANERYLEAMLDDECARYAYHLQGLKRKLVWDERGFTNPVATILSEGDETHFVPIHDGTQYTVAVGEGSAFCCYSP